MSKQRSAPISDFLSSILTRASRSRRKRSKSMRCSQSTAMVPYVLIAILNPSAKNLCHFKNGVFGRHRQVFQARGERDGHVHGSHPLHGRIEVIKSAIG